MPAIELGRHQRHHVDAVDDEVCDVAVDLGIDQLDAVEPDAGEVDLAEHGSGHVAIDELRTAELVVGGRPRHRLTIRDGRAAQRPATSAARRGVDR